MARVLSFLAFLYLARVLGVDGYGTVEFALSVVIYLQVFTEGGLDLWATREVARGKSIKTLVAQVMPLRMGLGALGFGILLVLLPLFPSYPQLGLLLVLFGLRAFSQAVDLRWVFMGQEQMRVVAIGLIIAQLIFAVLVFSLVHDPKDVLWVPVAQLLGNLVIGGYFFYWIVRSEGVLRIWPSLRGLKEAIGPSLSLGSSRGLALLSFNFDTLLVGFLLNATAVGLYGAAYRPLTALLTVSSTYGLGLYPVLSRAYHQDQQEFHQLVQKSLRITAICAIPIGVGGSFLAGSIIQLLFGSSYAQAAPVLQILSWSAMLVVLRGTFRQTLAATGNQRLDLVCALVATAVNVGLNFLLIPMYGLIGAAAATLASEVVWLSSAIGVSASVGVITMRSGFMQMMRPLAAGGAMSACFLLTANLLWPVQVAIAGTAFLTVLLLSGDKEVRSWIPKLST